MSELPPTTPENNQIDHLNPLIAEKLNIENAQREGSMPLGWMISYQEAKITACIQAGTIDEAIRLLSAPEWDVKLVAAYYDTLLQMINERTSILQEARDTPMHRAAIYAATLALQGEATSYYDPKRKRPTYPLTALLTWPHHTRTVLAFAQQQNLSMDHQKEILRLRVESLNHELQALVTFAQNGGWNSEQEKKGVITKLSGMKETLFTHILPALADETTMQSCKQKAQSYIDRAIQEFGQIDHVHVLDTEAKKHTLHAYLERLGITDAPERILEICSAELEQLQGAANKLRATFTNCIDTTLPTSNDEVTAKIKAAMRWYTENIMNTEGVMPNSTITGTPQTDLQDAPMLSAEEFASMSPDGKTLRFPAHNSDKWKTTYALLPAIVAHELTHVYQKNNTAPIPEGWMGSEAREGGAVAMEVYVHSIETNPQALYQAIHFEIRKIARFMLNVEYHTGSLAENKIKERAQELCPDVADTALSGILSTTQGPVERVAMYWFGPRFIYAYAKAEHNGNLKEALQTLAQTTGLRLPAHALINSFVPGQFSLSDHMFETHPLAQIVEQYIQTHSSTTPN